MASSRKRSSSSSRGRTEEFVAQVAAQLAGVVRPGDRVAAALSGGVDSVVLLDVLHRLRTRLRIRLSALHVNHQLNPLAPRWAAFCRRVCHVRGIPFRIVKVTVARGDSLEAAARAARYEVFFRQGCDYIVLAHHQDDQVETLLLQLLRGAGVKGLAAMPLVRAEGIPHPSSLEARAPAILRPLLDVTRAEIEAYAKARRLTWVEDESNADLHFQRNFLRHEILPEIARRFPAYRATIARAARHLAETAALLDEMAVADGAGALVDGTLATAALRRLSPARARNLLRHFLAARAVVMPNTVRLDEALRQVLTARKDAQVAIDLGAFGLRQFEGRLHLVSRRAALRPGDLGQWRGEREVPVPELGGALVMTPSLGAGLSLARLREHPVAIRARSGGERLQPDRRRPRRTLKNLMQEARIPPWERERLPLVFCGGDLAWVPAIGIDCAYQAAPGERSVSPSWRFGADPGGPLPMVAGNGRSPGRKRAAQVP
jgi:tRNA(Ile)-lysidine synthase